MRVFVHDFSGHPFQVQLSRWLAQQGHVVLHAFSADFLTPHGALSRRDDDLEAFGTCSISIGRSICKASLIRRAFDEWAYGSRLIERMAAFHPDLVLSANGSPLVHFRARAWAARHSTPYVYWLQDIYVAALAYSMGGKPPMMRKIPIAVLRWIEFSTIERSDGVIAISGDFRTILDEEGVSTTNLHVIENWAPPDDIVPRNKTNDWSKAEGLADKFVFMYSGTLGLKHNPSLLSKLAASFRDDPEVRVVVISNGAGRNRLEEIKKREGLDNLILLDFVPFEVLSNVLGAGDVQVAILEPFAGRLSVPSKILTYISAECPVLSAIPPENLGARILIGCGVGLNAAPTDVDGFIRNAQRLRNEPARLPPMRAAARAYKSTHFDINKIGAEFLSVFEAASKAATPRANA